MKYLAIILSFIVISIIILSACCLAKSSAFEHGHDDGPCIGSCVTTANTAPFANLFNSDFSKLLFTITAFLVLTVFSLYNFPVLVKKYRQDDFKILFYLDKHIQAGLLHPKLY
jgi:hypothetical protein